MPNEISTSVSGTEKENKNLGGGMKGSSPGDSIEKENGLEKGMAAAAKQISSKNSNFFFVLLAAFILAISSGIVILFLKRDLKSLI